MDNELKVGVVGGSGRMGQMVVAQVTETDGCAVVGGSDQRGHDVIGKDIGAVAGIAFLGVNGIPISSRRLIPCIPYSRFKYSISSSINSGSSLVYSGEG